MAAVRAENMVLGPEREGHADGGGFLPDGEVGRSGVIVGDTFIGALGFDFVENGFKFPNGAHVPPDVQQVFGGISGQLLLDGPVVSVRRNIGEADNLAGKDFFRLYNN